MGSTTNKGEIGEAMVLADLRRRGHGVAIPFGHDLPFDLILIRSDTGELEKVQCKYTESDGKVVLVRCASYSDWVTYKYTAAMVDWIAAYDATSDRCYYVHSSEFDGMAVVSLRVAPTVNGQAKRIRWASNYRQPELVPDRIAGVPPLPFPAISPE